MRAHASEPADRAAEPPSRSQDGLSMSPRASGRPRPPAPPGLSAGSAGTGARKALSSRSTRSRIDDASGVGPAAPAAAAEEHPEGRSSRRHKLARELVLELHVLRTALEETLPVFLARVQGELTEITRRLEAGIGGPDDALPSAGALGLALREVRGARVKPRKGRAKDLTRISRVAERLAQLDGGE
jgi:hypothetical protein